MSGVYQESGGARQPNGRAVEAAAESERQAVVGLMRSVSEELSGLRTALQRLRIDSQTVHRQIRRLHRASCSASRRARRRTKWATSTNKNNRRLPGNRTSTVTSLHLASGGG